MLMTVHHYHFWTRFTNNICIYMLSEVLEPCRKCLWIINHLYTFWRLKLELLVKTGFQTDNNSVKICFCFVTFENNLTDLSCLLTEPKISSYLTSEILRSGTNFLSTGHVNICCWSELWITQNSHVKSPLCFFFRVYF